MPKLAFATDRQLRAAKPRERDYRIGCGGQLFLRVTPAGHKYWQLRYYKNNGTETLHQFAKYPETSLLEAKKQRDDLLPVLQAGQLPPAILARRADKAQLTFDQCARAYIEAKRHEWKNKKHAQQWTNTLTQHASPVFGTHLVQTITRDDVLKCLEPIWLTSNETASRLRGRIESILDWAKAKDLRHGDNPAAWRGGLQNLLSAPSKTQKIVNHPSLPYTELPAFMRRLQTTNGESAAALIFLILTATRTSEVLNASWDEINDGVWAIPAGRMKAGREHRVPLSPAALELLDWRPKTGPFVFTNALLGDRPMSNMSMAMLLRRADMGHVTVHGFRSTFRNWGAECTSYPREVCEHALAHQLPDKVEAAYLRSDLLERRRSLMADWAVFCQSGVAVPLPNELSNVPAETGKI